LKGWQVAETIEQEAGYTAVLYRRVRELIDDGAQLVEVLPEEDYEKLHLPAAISFPLKQLDEASAAVLDRSKPVIVYCWDGLCDLSPRAPQRLASLGFTQVYDYSSSKVDWMARGLPLEGRRASEKRAIDFVGPEVATCRMRDTVGPMRERVAASAYGFALVLTGEDAVIGRLRRAALEGDPAEVAEDVMEPGPSTQRPNLEPSKLLEKLRQRDLRTAVLTDPDGRLLGVVRRQDLPESGEE
jgi:rhodanese-related sulfurtransferase